MNAQTKLLILLVLLTLGIAGCGQADIEGNERCKVTLYSSNGKPVRSWSARGPVRSVYEAHGARFRELDSGHWVHVTGAVVVEPMDEAAK